MAYLPRKGSVKDTYTTRPPDITKGIFGEGYFLFKCAVSVRDLKSRMGHIEIPNRAEALALLAAHNMELLEEWGVPTTYLGMIPNGDAAPVRLEALSAPTNRMGIMLAEVPPIDDDYRALKARHVDAPFMVPGEVIHRNYVPPEASKFKKYQRAKAAGDTATMSQIEAELGLDHEPQPFEKLPIPVITPTSKYEKGGDVDWTMPEFEQKSGLPPEQFIRMIIRAKIANYAVTEDLTRKGLLHADGKLEFAYGRVAAESPLEVKVADTYGTFDENRIYLKDRHLSKELLRALVDKKFGDDIKAAKKQAEEAGRPKDWTLKDFLAVDIVVPADFLTLMGEMHMALSNVIVGEKYPRLQFDAPPLEKVAHDLAAAVEAA